MKSVINAIGAGRIQRVLVGLIGFGVADSDLLFAKHLRDTNDTAIEWGTCICMS
jgi:hypothetical protein